MKWSQLQTPWSLVAMMSALLMTLWTAPLMAMDSHPLYFSVNEAREGVGLHPEQPIIETPISYEDGVAEYRLENLDDGEIYHVLVKMATNPLIGWSDDTGGEVVTPKASNVKCYDFWFGRICCYFIDGEVQTCQAM